ncbi:hypothetical protein, conserved [Babesia bigemina]|uniref:Uncharacterized protein n=1 Tax=Babesia bigemina TaxID=5866 RepID=A0A061BJL4_BABBI|nr:hypothetical protein, conserved [Babesia bigemina]CDR71656.1 hypothetical protein, conserved [Babesia bigemina]|eukprot:XP_012770603.1 hypothetical protein, conserved [Babesia bigemina]
MGFLSGVLGAVKNENEVTTYDKYISGENNRLKKVLDTLNKNIGSGRDGLAASVAAVKGWLEGYEEELQEKTLHVLNDLGKFHDDISGIYTTNISAGDNLQEQLSKWTSTVDDIDKYINSTETRYVNKLDSVLLSKLMNEIKHVQKVVEHLKSVAENDEVKRQAKVVDTVLVNQKERIEKEIKEGFMDLQKQLAYKFRCIDKKIIDLCEIKRTQLGNVKHVIQDGKSKAQGMFVEFDNKYATPILQHFENIRSALVEIDRSKNPSGRKDTSKLKEEVTKIDKCLDAFRINLGGCVGELENWMYKTKRTIAEAESNLRKIIDKSVVKNEIQDIENVASNLKHTITEPLNQFMKDIEGEVAMAVQGARWHFDKIKAEVGVADGIIKDTTLCGNWNALKSTIGGVVTEITGSGNGKASLGGITGDVKSYVIASYAENKFESQVLPGWIEDALQTETAKGWLDMYINVGKPDAVQKVRAAIISQLESTVRTKVAVNLPKGDKEKAHENLGDIAKYLKAYGAAIDEHIKKTSIGVFVAGVDEALKKTMQPPPGTNTNPLRTVVEIALSSVSASAKQTAKEIGDFTGKYSIGRVEEAVSQVKELTSKIENDPGRKITESLSTVHTQIGHLDTSLQEINKSAQGLNVNATKTTLDSISSDIKTTLGKLMDEISTLAKDNIAWYLDNLKMGSIDTVLGEIGDHINRVQTSTVEQINKVQNGISPIITSLEGLPDMVEYKMADVVEKMKALREHVELIYSHFQHIEFIATTANDKIEKAIKATQTTLSDAYASAETLVEALENNLLAISADAFRTMTNEVRKLFADGHIADLQSLRKLVSTQLKIISCAINKDLNTGVKGFLKTLSGESIDLYAAGHIERRPAKKEQKTNLLDEVKDAIGRGEHGDKVANFTNKFKTYSEHIFTYLDKDLKQIFASQPRVIGDYPNRVSTIQRNLTDLLTHISTHKHFDHQVPQMLETLKTSISTFKSTHFGNASYPVLDAFPRSLEQFVGELERMYVSRYEGGFENVLLVYANTGNVTEEGKNCAKIFLTIIGILLQYLQELYGKCDPTNKKGMWREKHISLYDLDATNKRNANPLGHWFQRRGYIVPEDEKTQNGELRNATNLKGAEIIKLCHNIISNVDPATIKLLGIYGNQRENNVKLINLLMFLNNMKLSDFYKVCHLNMRPNPKPPTTIYEMMQWLPGLWFNPMFSKVTGYFTTLLTSLKEEYKLQADALDVAVTSNLKSEIKSHLDGTQLSNTLRNVCLYSHNTLVAILGHGHADGRYACEFYMNADNLMYPSSPSACFDMLADIVCRLYTQLCFLYKQCYNGRGRGGWEDCWYGKGIAGSAWHCNDYQCPNQECEQKDRQTDDQNADQSGNQKCNQHSKCGIKSPLQSFLEDGLQGFLPHRLDKVGCGVKCSVSNHHGKPCLTPMGLADIGITASHTKTGAHLKEALRNFCGPISHLTKLCSIITCLIRRPPQTLGDMFAFYYHFINGWYETGKGERENHREIAFNLAVKAANFKIPETKLEIKSMFSSSSHATHAPGKLPKHNGDLLSLVACDSKTLPGLPCGRYLQPISNDIMVVYSKYHASHYLSWVVYITETFYDLLKKLYDECCRNCNRPGKRCYDKSCVKDCQVRFSYGYKHTNEDNKLAGFDTIKHESLCGSIVKCRATHAAIYSSGFTFGSPFEMSGDDGRRKKRTCEDFCQALGFVVRPGNALYMLVNKTIPDFLWQIREKFFWTTVALWSLSLFYLICVMVGRLDVLHIRSHLRIPSSHKITAQSLLAAAQVGRLAKISYLQP